MRRFLFAASLFLLFGSATIFANGEAERDQREFGNPAADGRVLIAAEWTPYKERLVREVVSRLDNGNTFVRIVDHQNGELDGEDPRDYDAVLITNSGARAQVRPWVISWLDEWQAHDDNIVVHTTQINEWTPQVRVDSVTSASSNRNVPQIAGELVDRARRLLSLNLVSR
jgi:hypothetical protein